MPHTRVPLALARVRALALSQALALAPALALALALAQALSVALALTRREGSPSALPPLAEQWLHVRYAGVAVLPPVAVYPPLEGDAPFWVQMRYDLTGLHIALGGRGYVDGAAVPGWDPQPHWRFGVGAFNSASNPTSIFVGVDEYSVHGLTVARGSAVC